MTPRDPKKRNRLILTCGCILGVLAAIWFGLWLPVRAHLRIVAVAADLAKAQFENAQRAVENKARLKADLEQAELQLKLEERSIAGDDSYRWLIKALSDFQTNYAVKCQQFDPPAGGGPKPAPGLTNYLAAVYSVSGVARYHEFGRFLADFENRFRHIQLQNLELEPALDVRTDLNEPGRLNFKMDLLVLLKPTVLPPVAPKK